VERIAVAANEQTSLSPTERRARSLQVGCLDIRPVWPGGATVGRQDDGRLAFRSGWSVIFEWTSGRWATGPILGA